ncbi:unnamed protein product [Adineta ricciae]|uniref:Uncharacterized protein n=1 Tax=Adineta ricciae TaxID=249248 RepID=A0A814Q277_ADIRI|nr:unnamed protein product [Adineta ricciae]CAF1629795.1 unnamed protein product [Adineta ricciae]
MLEIDARRKYNYIPALLDSGTVFADSSKFRQVPCRRIPAGIAQEISDQFLAGTDRAIITWEVESLPSSISPPPAPSPAQVIANEPQLDEQGSLIETLLMEQQKLAIEHKRNWLFGEARGAADKMDRIHSVFALMAEWGVMLLPRTMIPEAGFHEFPTKSLRKLAISERDPLIGNAASMKSPEYHGTGRFRAGLFDLGTGVIIYTSGEK